MQLFWHAALASVMAFGLSVGHCDERPGVELQPKFGHFSGADKMISSEDGRHLLSIDTTAAILWDAATLDIRYSSPKVDETVKVCGALADQFYFKRGRNDGTQLFSWDAGNLTERYLASLPNISRCSVAGAKKLLLVQMQDTYQLVDPHNPNSPVESCGRTGAVPAGAALLAVSPNADLMAVSVRDSSTTFRIDVVHCESGDRRSVPDQHFGTDVEGRSISAEFAPDGYHLLIKAYDDLKLWDLRQYRPISMLRDKEWIGMNYAAAALEPLSHGGIGVVVSMKPHEGLLVTILRSIASLFVTKTSARQGDPRKVQDQLVRWRFDSEEALHEAVEAQATLSAQDLEEKAREWRTLLASNLRLGPFVLTPREFARTDFYFISERGSRLARQSGFGDYGAEPVVYGPDYTVPSLSAIEYVAADNTLYMRSEDGVGLRLSLVDPLTSSRIVGYQSSPDGAWRYGRECPRGKKAVNGGVFHLTYDDGNCIPLRSMIPPEILQGFEGALNVSRLEFSPSGSLVVAFLRGAGSRGSKSVAFSSGAAYGCILVLNDPQKSACPIKLKSNLDARNVAITFGPDETSVAVLNTREITLLGMKISASAVTTLKRSAKASRWEIDQVYWDSSEPALSGVSFDPSGASLTIHTDKVCDVVNLGSDEKKPFVELKKMGPCQYLDKTRIAVVDEGTSTISIRSTDRDGEPVMTIKLDRASPVDHIRYAAGLDVMFVAFIDGLVRAYSIKGDSAVTLFDVVLWRNGQWVVLSPQGQMSTSDVLRVEQYVSARASGREMPAGELLAALEDPMLVPKSLSLIDTEWQSGQSIDDARRLPKVLSKRFRMDTPGVWTGVIAVEPDAADLNCVRVRVNRNWIPVKGRDKGDPMYDCHRDDDVISLEQPTGGSTEWNVTLDLRKYDYVSHDGADVIVLEAEDFNKARSRHVALPVTGSAASPIKFKGLFVGARNYPASPVVQASAVAKADSANLTWPVDDALALGKVLGDIACPDLGQSNVDIHYLLGRSSNGRVRLRDRPCGGAVTDSPQEKGEIVEPPEPTKKAILAALDGLVAADLKSEKGEPGAWSREIVFVFLSGHGTVEDNQYFFIPELSREDNGKFQGVREEDRRRDWWISAAEIGERLIKLRARNVVLVLDTCGAGSFTLPGAKGGRTRTTPMNVSETATEFTSWPGARSIRRATRPRIQGMAS